MRVLTIAGLLFALLTLGAACGHLDMTPPASAERVLNCAVTNNTQAELPPDTEVTVRVMDVSAANGRGEVLAEETVVNPPRMPVMVRVEFQAEDAVLRRGVNVEARVAVGGKLRYMTTSAHPITTSNVNETHVIQLVTVANR